MELHTLYPKSVETLKDVLGVENYSSIERYLHAYDGTATSAKPVAKYVTIYWVGRAADMMILRTEGEDDIVLSEVGGEAVPTIIFRKLKAVYLRRFMQLMREQWELHATTIQREAGYGQDYDFLSSCSIAVGIAGEGKGVLHGRCMKCPVDVLMGATSARATYNLVSRFVGDSAYATTSDIERRTGNSVDEVTYTTIMGAWVAKEGEQRTGALFSETHVEPATLFVGKIVLPMVSPPELLHVLWMLTHPIKVGARTSIEGALEVRPVAMVADLFEVGTAYEVAERLHGVKSIEKAREGILEYLDKEVKFATASNVVSFTKEVVGKIKTVDILHDRLVVELWKNAKNYVNGVLAYMGSTTEERKPSKGK